MTSLCRSGLNPPHCQARWGVPRPEGRQPERQSEVMALVCPAPQTALKNRPRPRMLGSCVSEG